MTITQLTHNNVRDVQREIIAAAQAVAERHGLKMELSGRTDFDSLQMKLGRMSLSVTQDASGNTLNAEEEQFRRHASYLGIPDTWFGKRFFDNASHFEVYKLFPNRPKNCIGIRNVRSGKTYVCPPAFVKARI